MEIFLCFVEIWDLCFTKGSLVFVHLYKICLALVRRGDVLAAWSGIRPLVTDPNSKDTQSICRNHVVSISDSGLVTIAGQLLLPPLTGTMSPLWL